MDETNKCALGMCPEHPHTVERLAMLEKGLSSVELTMQSVGDKIEKVHNATRDEFKHIREDITNGILRRYPGGIVFIISVLTGLCCALAATLFSHLLDR